MTANHTHPSRRDLIAALCLQSALARPGNARGGAPETAGARATPPSLQTQRRAAGRQWYVDNAVRVNGDGTSWRTAWSALAAIRWDSIAAGDTIFISGGTSGRHYHETLTIGASGAPGAPITITAGVGPGHAGRVTIDAQGVRSQCIVVGNHDHLILQDLTIQNTADDANLTVNGSAAGVLIRRLASYSGVGSGGDCRCFDIRNCVASGSGFAVILEDCVATTAESTTSQTDTLWTSGNAGVLVQHNTFTVANTDPTGHSDCIQSYADHQVIFRCNRLAHPNGGVNNHGFIISDVQAGGTVYFYDNVVVMGSTPGQAAGKPEIAIFREYLTAGYNGIVKIWNNTIYGGYSGYHTYATAGPMPDDEFRNNIIYGLPISVAPYGLGSGNLLVHADTDYNVSFVANDGVVVYGRGWGVGAARSTTAKTSGRFYFEIQLGMVLSGDNTMIGIGTGEASPNAFTGASRDSLGWAWHNGRIYIGGGYADAELVTGSAADVVAFAVDFERRRIWVRNLTSASGWNGEAIGRQDPGTGQGGYPFGDLAPGPWFIMVSIGRAGDYVILNPGRYPFIGKVPEGFLPWGATTTFNPANIGAAATLTAPVAAIAGDGYTDWAAWNALGYDQHGINADPQFVDAGAGDFHLRPGSPAIAAGITIPMVATDYANAPRSTRNRYDIGAYAADD